MSKAGQYNYKGINAQAWAAMSLFLQYMRDAKFASIQLEAANFEDFNLIFNDGKKIISESLRLYPPAWALGRQVIKDYRVEKYSIPAGSIILMSQYVMHRDKRYFYDSENFHPERWTDDFKKCLPKFSYFPFGGGIRGCIGEPFALMEAIIIIATIWREWDMQLVPSQKIALKPLITLRPKYGMRMRISRR